MPELPEVETIARQLRDAGAEGRRIVGVEIFHPPLAEGGAERLARGLVGRRLDRIGRRGKWLLFHLDTGSALLVHLRMSGAFALEEGPHDRARLRLEGGLVLHFRDPRKFGRWRLEPDPAGFLAGLAPDGLSVELPAFRERLRRFPRRGLKALLLDQRAVVSGIGNIYADEALWRARLHPARRAETLSAADERRLHRAVRSVLEDGVRGRGVSIGEGRGDFRDLHGRLGGHGPRTAAYGRAGKPCLRCGKPLEKARIAGRTTVYCPACQPPP